MELLKNYKGAVFFIDILGISALTNENLKLQAEDFKPWLNKNKNAYSNQYLGAKILAEFREILIELDKKHTSVTITQLSDCAFIWSKSICEVIFFASEFMHKAINAGVFCRGGISYGEIIETNQPHKLGRFILGDAVTKAAKLESLSKGCRILIDQDVPMQLYEESETISNKIFSIFQPFTNPVDFKIYDEFKWYLTPVLDDENLTDLNNLSFIEKVEFTKQRLVLGNIVRTSPKFNWNAKNEHGKIHLRASVSFLTENKLLMVLHNFEWKNLIEKRKNITLNKMNKNIMDYQDFRKIKTDKFPEDWEE